MRISLIGAGNIQYHYFTLLGLSEVEFRTKIQNIAEILVNNNVELVLLPDRGAPFEVAKEFRKRCNRDIYATIPHSDRDFGIAHLKEYINTEVNGNKIFTKIIDTQDWYKQDLTCTLYGDVILLLGNSLGSLGELAYGYYLYKLFTGGKQGVHVIKDRIHPDISAGSKIPFDTVIYAPFMKSALPIEIERYIQKLNCNIHYVKDMQELDHVLSDLQNAFQVS